MKVEPSAQELLDIARESILAEIAPALPESQRYVALMAANALAIARRDLAAAATEQGEIARLVSLLGDWSPAGRGESDLREGNARLAARIRAGGFDEGPFRARLVEHLRETVRARLAVSNPRTLGRQGRTPP